MCFHAFLLFSKWFSLKNLSSFQFSSKNLGFSTVFLPAEDDDVFPSNRFREEIEADELEDVRRFVLGRWLAGAKKWQR